MSHSEILRAQMGFEPGTNPLHVVTDDSYDLKPALNVTKSEIKKAYGSLEGDQILLINFGECHDITTHITLQILLTQWMHDNDMNPLIALEKPFNLVPTNTTQHVAQLYNHNDTTLYSPYTCAYFFHQLWTQNIATAFVDAGRSKCGSYLDHNDPVLKEIFGDIRNNIPLTSKNGMYFRNAIMLKRAFNSATARGHRVIFLSQGQAHLLGLKTKGINLKHSTQGIIGNDRERNKLNIDTHPLKTLIVLPHYKYAIGDGRLYYWERSVPNAAFSQIRNTIIPNGLSDNTHRASYLSSLFGYRNEKRTLQKIFKASNEENRKLPSFSKMQEMAQIGAPCFT